MCLSPFAGAGSAPAAVARNARSRARGGSQALSLLGLLGPGTPVMASKPRGAPLLGCLRVAVRGLRTGSAPLGPAEPGLGSLLGPAWPAPSAISGSAGDPSLLDTRDSAPDEGPIPASSASLDAPDPGAAPPAYHAKHAIFANCTAVPPVQLSKG